MAPIEVDIGVEASRFTMAADTQVMHPFFPKFVLRELIPFLSWRPQHLLGRV